MGGLVRDYSLREALNIFCNVNHSATVHLKFHFQEKNQERHSNLESWIKTFFNHKLLGIMKQEYNKFKLCYKHPFKEQKDLYLIVVINEDISMSMLTTYGGNISRRIGDNERR